MLRLATLIVSLAFLVAPLSTSALEPSWTNVLDEAAVLAAKNAAASGIPSPRPQTGGEDIGTATPIAGLPFTDTGNTCGYANDYDEFCPYDGYAPDVVYSYAPYNDQLVNISLCNSDYDTKLLVYENTATNLHACSDDACGADGFRSAVWNVPMTEGNTYYIVVTGYGASCGDYILEMDETIGEVVECPAGALLEGEPECSDGYDDQYDSGCSGYPEPVFVPLYGTPDGSPVTVCGTSGTFLVQNFNYRDTDWYELTVLQEDTITFDCVGEFPVQILLIDGNGGCGAVTILASDTAGPVPDLASFTYTCAPGIYWYWVGPSVFDGIPCGVDYVTTITGYTAGAISTRPASWGSVKGLYRR